MQRFRVWLALLATPLVLAAVFMVVAAYLVATRGLRGDDVRAAIEPVAVYPVAIGFAASLLITRRLARADGLSLRDVGWSRPGRLDVVVGCAAGAAICALNARVLHPLIQRADPSFDPTLSAYPLPAAVAAFTLAVAAEDTLYRGYALHVLRGRHGTTAAVAITTALYALIAPQGLPLSLWAVFFGLVLCGLRLWRGTLWAGARDHHLARRLPRAGRRTWARVAGGPRSVRAHPARARRVPRGRALTARPRACGRSAPPSAWSPRMMGLDPGGFATWTRTTSGRCSATRGTCTPVSMRRAASCAASPALATSAAPPKS